MQCAANTEIESHCILTNDSYYYGQSVAKIHKCSTSFKPKEKFTNIDLSYLISKPISQIENLFPEMDISTIKLIGRKISDKLNALDQRDLVKSYIHGDITGGNACVTQESEYVFFDFDCCGYGWQVYDLAVFYWSLHQCQKVKLLWEGFLDGYRSIKQISNSELQAIPLLAAARNFWIIGYSIEQISVKGSLSYQLRDLKRDIEFFDVFENELIG